VAVSPEGRWVAAVDNHSLIGYGTELTPWDTDRPDQPRVGVLEDADGRVGTVAFGPAGVLYAVTALTGVDPGRGRRRAAEWHGGKMMVPDSVRIMAETVRRTGQDVQKSGPVKDRPVPDKKRYVRTKRRKQSGRRVAQTVTRCDRVLRTGRACRACGG
jgi:hypothetical protein